MLQNPDTDPPAPSKSKPKFRLGMFASTDAHLEYCVQECLGGRFHAGQSNISYFNVPNAHTPRQADLEAMPARYQAFACGQSLKIALGAPREFKMFDALVFFVHEGAREHLHFFLPYLKQVLKAKRALLPVAFLLVRESQEGPAPEPFPETSTGESNGEGGLSFLHLLLLKEGLDEQTQLPGQNQAIIGELRLGENDALLAHKLRILAEEIRHYHHAQQPRDLALLKVEQIVDNLRACTKEIETTPPSLEALVDALIHLETKIPRPLNRPLLVNWFGFPNTRAVRVLNCWERVDLRAPDEILAEVPDPAALDERVAALVEECRLKQVPPNYANLRRLGCSFDELEQVSARLRQQATISRYDFHKTSRDFQNFLNMEEFVVIWNGRTVFSRETKASSTERTTIFSGMIQAIEQLREEWIKKIDTYQPRDTKIELLDFGPLKALIGSDAANHLKIISRFREKPAQETQERLRLFMWELRADPAWKDPQLDEFQLGRIVGTLFHRVFNVLPLKLNLFDVFSVDHAAPAVPGPHLTRRERQILAIIRKIQPASLREIIASRGPRFSKSDFVETLIGLLNSGLLVKKKLG